MRKACKRNKVKQALPMLVVRGLGCNEWEIKERMFSKSFTGGWATKDHFNFVADMFNVTKNAARMTIDEETLSFLNIVEIALTSIRDRYERTGKLGVNGEENKLLDSFSDFYRDYWMRKSSGLYQKAYDQLNDDLRKIPDRQKHQVTDKESNNAGNH
jgi:hypothetical protein